MSTESYSNTLPMESYFKSKGYVPGGIITNSRHENLDIEAMPPFLRTLLVTDGTVTKSLEAFFWEPVVVVVEPSNSRRVFDLCSIRSFRCLTVKCVLTYD